MGQSMLQLARVQDQTNRHLQQHIQQGQLNMQAHAGALHELSNSTIREFMTTYFLAFLFMMEVTEMNFFHGWIVWKQHVIIVDGILRQKH